MDSFHFKKLLLSYIYNMCVEEYLSTYSIIDFLKSKKKKTLVTLDVICVIVITPNMVGVL